MVGGTVPPRSDAVQLAALLDSPEISHLAHELEATRWTGRPGYPVHAMLGMALAKSVYGIPTWTRIVALVFEHAALRTAIGCPDVASVPSVHACYRFTAKLRRFKPLMDACLDRVTAALYEQMPELGKTVAIDASDMPAYANGQRYLYKGGPERKTYSDPDATWGHRSAVSTRAAGSFYGYKLHQVVCAITGLPLAWRVETAKDSESTFAMPLLDAVKVRGSGPRSPSWTWAMTTKRSTQTASSATATRSSRFGRRLRSRPASTGLPSASMASGPSPEPKPSGGRPSGAARPVSVPRPASGSGPAACTP